MRYESRISNNDLKILLIPETEDDWRIIDMTGTKELQNITRPTRDSEINNAMMFTYVDKKVTTSRGVGSTGITIETDRGDAAPIIPKP